MTDHLITDWPTDRICVLQLNRPEKYNALGRALTDDLRIAVRGLRDSNARVVVLAGNGPGFCAGADLKERRAMTDAEVFAHNRAINALVNEIASLPMVTIAAMHGAALGGGCELSLACDLRFASASARIGLTEARIGAVPGAGGTQRLPRLIGIARALEMLLSGEPVGADRAAEWGLVNAVLPDDALMGHVLDIAQLVAKRSRRGTALLKDAVYSGMDRDLAAGLEIEGRVVAEVLRSADYREGLSAFAERREPVFE